jgi:hypothetical protein
VSRLPGDHDIDRAAGVAQRPPRRLCLAVARGGANCFGGGGNGSRTGSGQNLARIALSRHTSNKTEMFPLTNPAQYICQEDDDIRGGGARFPMPFIDQPAPAAMVGMTDSSLVDLKISRSGFHPNHTAPDKDKNKIPNGFST